MTELAIDSRGNALPAYRWGSPQKLPIGVDPETTEKPFGENISVVGVLATADFRFKLGKNPVANESCSRIPANMFVPLRVFPGERISVVAYGDAEGEVEITEME